MPYNSKHLELEMLRNQEEYFSRNQMCLHNIWMIRARVRQNLQDDAARPGSSVRHASSWYSDGHVFDPPVRQKHTFLDIDHEIISTAILSLRLIQLGQLSVTDKRICTEYWLTA